MQNPAILWPENKNIAYSLIYIFMALTDAYRDIEKNYRQVTCKACGKKDSVPKQFIGAFVKCSYCGEHTLTGNIVQQVVRFNMVAERL